MPEPALLNKLGWVRLLYNVSLNPNKPENDPKRYGNTDLNFTISRYRPYLQRVANAGLKTVLVFTHQTFGEGQGYNWGQMSSGRWRDLTRKYAEMVGQIAAQFKNTGLVYAYQIWNEQDTDPEHYRAAVPVPAADYAHLLTETIRAIRAVDSETLIITGGHVSGPDLGSAYAQATINAMPSGVRPDGIAFHPYGNGPAGSPYTVFATLDGVIRKFARVLPDKPVWITEWGVLDRQNDTTIAGPVSQYASGFLNIITREFPGQVACAIWYAWSDGMDNGYGLVKKDGSAKQPLYDTFLKG
jgi:hypothetical protein